MLDAWRGCAARAPPRRATLRRFPERLGQLAKGSGRAARQGLEAERGRCGEKIGDLEHSKPHRLASIEKQPRARSMVGRWHARGARSPAPPFAAMMRRIGPPPTGGGLGEGGGGRGSMPRAALCAEAGDESLAPQTRRFPSPYHRTRRFVPRTNLRAGPIPGGEREQPASSETSPSRAAAPRRPRPPANRRAGTGRRRCGSGGRP